MKYKYIKYLEDQNLKLERSNLKLTGKLGGASNAWRAIKEHRDRLKKENKLLKAKLLVLQDETKEIKSSHEVTQIYELDLTRLLDEVFD